MFYKQRHMKNIIIIDVDTERELPIKIGKSPESQQPTTPEEAKSVVLTDLSCILETHKILISIASQSGYANKEELVAESIKKLNELLIPIAPIKSE